MAQASPLPSLPSLGLVAQRHETDITVLWVNGKSQKHFAAAWVTAHATGGVTQGECRIDEKHGTHWNDAAERLGQLTDGLVLTLWAEPCVERLREQALKHNQAALTFANIQDINHWSGPARGVIRMNVSDLHGSFFPGHHASLNTPSDHAAALAQVADEIVYSHGAQMTGLGSSPARTLAADRAGNTKLLAIRIRKHLQEACFQGTDDLVYALKAPAKALDRALFYGLKAGVIELSAVVDADQANKLERLVTSDPDWRSKDTRALTNNLRRAIRADHKSALPSCVLAAYIDKLRDEGSPIGQSSLALG